MTIEEFKIRLKNNSLIIYYSSNDDLLRKLEKTLLSYGWMWRNYTTTPIIDRYLNNNSSFYLASNYFGDGKILTYSNSMNSLSEEYKINLSDEVIKTINNVLCPIPSYKPKVFDKTI